ncbi:cation:proton antiporter [Brevibacillus sp. SYSU BS000544]|uniref:cation:proton antiporter n=1 Tax=Brevibacillus sp. SYSU BS000544 TaxID=3416443 RepID=UPI003CE4BB3D
MEETTQLVHHVLLLLVLILTFGIISGKIANKLKLPDVVLFLIAGLILGQGLHWIIEPSRSFTNQFILTLGATLILFDGGRLIRMETLKKVWLSVVMLSIPGVFITTAVVAYAVVAFFDLPWIYAILLASIIASTDPATLIPVFKQIRIKHKVKETVESESAFNDATASILTFSVLAVALGTQSFSLGHAVVDFLKVSIGGILVGLVIGIAISYLVAHSKLGFFKDYTTIFMVVAAVAPYLIGDLLHVSGFMATFVAGLVWGNTYLFGFHMEEKQDEMNHFIDNMTLKMRMMIFILLGSQVDLLAISKYLWSGLLVILVFMFIARPLTVYLCTLPDRKAEWTQKERLFMCWVRETGVIPAALSGMVTGMGVPHADIIASVTFLAILITILLQASTTAFVARKLGVEENQAAGKIG